MSDEVCRIRRPERLSSYFKQETGILAVITVTGILYNLGMIAGPWFEGKLAQYLCDIIAGTRQWTAMVWLALAYVAAILFVQGTRYLKRLYVRKFGNNINRSMKQALYRSLIHMDRQELESESVGAIMTRAVADVDACEGGMRKFTTEVFDTGVVMVAYLGMLLYYDWRLTLISMLFPPFAYIIAERMKKVVSTSAAKYKESAGRLNGATLDRIDNAVTYRVYGQEESQNLRYEDCLRDYEKKAVYANIWENTMQPLYQIISMMGAVCILWFGAKNVLGNGWTSWDIAAFTTYLSCFTKLATKSSRAAKLFNAVQKAQVSWERIKPFMREIPEDQPAVKREPARFTVSHLSFSYPSGKEILKDISFTADPGEIIGVTGPVACGKSTLGKVLLHEYPYTGSIQFGGRELEDGVTGYMGHQPELLSGSIKENILLGEQKDVLRYLNAVCMEEEVQRMPEGIHTAIGNGGIRLSGGQQARLALARTLCHKKPVIVLDDPFSAVDQKTEREIMRNLKAMTIDRIVIILSHRLTLFPQMSQVFWMEDGKLTISDHEHLMTECPEYARLYRMQTEGGSQYEA